MDHRAVASASARRDADAALSPDPHPATSTKALFIGGRSGVGKTTVAAELSRLLAQLDVAHALIEGDNLDQAHPEPWRHGIDLAEQNLAAMWQNYRAAGYTRVIYTNTVSVIETDALIAALGMGTEVVSEVISVLLTSSDSTAAGRLAGREIGSGLADAIERSRSAATRLDTTAKIDVRRIRTDGRSVPDIAREILALTGWAPTAETP